MSYIKVILSWSGNDSREIASALHEALDSVFDGYDVQFWISTQDIEVGKKWSDELTAALADSNFVILCFTPSNLTSAWMIYEAGAVSKMPDDSRVVPFVSGTSFESLPAPLRDFQGCEANEEGFGKLVIALNSFIKKRKSNHLVGKYLKGSIKDGWNKLRPLLNDIKLEPRDSEIEAPISVDPDYLYEYMGDRFGVGHQDVSFSCFIDNNGAAKFTREIEVKALQNLQSLDTFLFLADIGGDSDGQEIKAPVITTDDPFTNVKLIGTKILRSTTETLAGNNRVETKPYERVVAELGFDPALLRHSVVKYKMVEERKTPIYLQDTMDSFGWAVHRPTRHLRLSVTMPKERQPAMYNRNVRRNTTLGFSDQDVIAELERVPNPKLKDLPGGLVNIELDMTAPMIGLIYRLFWRY